jgi:CBS domain-containing protein
MRTAGDILRHKGDDVWSVAPDDTVLDALGIMAAKDIGAVVVMEGGEIVGILTERDYARKVVLLGRSSRESAIRDVMTSVVVCVPPDTTVGDCLSLMTARRVRHLPVRQRGRLIGLVSIGDLVHATITEQEQVIEHLQHYIAG